MILLLLLLSTEMSLARQHLPLGASEEVSKLADAYWSCVINKTSTYAKSREPSDAVGRAAVTACEDEHMEFVASFLPDTKSLGAAAIKKAEAEHDMMLESFEARLAAEAEKVVIEVRARAAK